jgi:hypothetical protein
MRLLQLARLRRLRLRRLRLPAARLHHAFKSSVPLVQLLFLLQAAMLQILTKPLVHLLLQCRVKGFSLLH